MLSIVDIDIDDVHKCDGEEDMITNAGNETAENTTMPVTEPPWPGYEDKWAFEDDDDPNKDGNILLKKGSC